MSAEVTEPNRWPVFARLAGKAQHDRLQLGDQCFGHGLFRGGAARGRGFHLLDDGLVGLSGLHRKLAGQQKVAAVAFCNLHHVSAMTQIVYIFLQNDFHVKLSNVSAALRRRCVSPPVS